MCLRRQHPQRGPPVNSTGTRDGTAIYHRSRASARLSQCLLFIIGIAKQWQKLNFNGDRTGTCTGTPGGRATSNRAAPEAALGPPGASDGLLFRRSPFPCAVPPFRNNGVARFYSRLLPAVTAPVSRLSDVTRRCRAIADRCQLDWEAIYSPLRAARLSSSHFLSEVCSTFRACRHCGVLASIRASASTFTSLQNLGLPHRTARFSRSVFHRPT